VKLLSVRRLKGTEEEIQTTLELFLACTPGASSSIALALLGFALSLEIGPDG